MMKNIKKWALELMNIITKDQAEGGFGAKLILDLIKLIKLVIENCFL